MASGNGGLQNSLGRFLRMNGAPVDASAFRVWHRLICLSDKVTGEVTTTEVYLSEGTHLSVRTVRKALRGLRELGVIERMPSDRKRVGRRNPPSRYRVTG